MLNFIKNMFTKVAIANIEIAEVETETPVRKRISLDEIEWAKQVYDSGFKGNEADWRRARYILNKYNVLKIRSNVKGQRPLTEKYKDLSLSELEQIVASSKSTPSQRKAAIKAAYTLGFKNARVTA